MDHVYADHVDVAADIAVIDIVGGSVAIGARSRLFIAKLHCVTLRRCRNANYWSKNDNDEQSNNDIRNIFEDSQTVSQHLYAFTTHMKKHYKDFGSNSKN